MDWPQYTFPGATPTFCSGDSDEHATTRDDASARRVTDPATETPLSDDVRRFLESQVESYDELEIALLLRRAGGAAPTFDSGEPLSRSSVKDVVAPEDGKFEVWPQGQAPLSA